MSQEVHVSSWVSIKPGCSISYRVNGDEIEFQFGATADGLEFVFHTAALRDFVDVAQAAMSERQ
ncbi:hypothetical protein [Actinophytocola sp. KF-1]